MTIQGSGPLDPTTAAQQTPQQAGANQYQLPEMFKDTKFTELKLGGPDGNIVNIPVVDGNKKYTISVALHQADLAPPDKRATAIKKILSENQAIIPLAMSQFINTGKASSVQAHSGHIVGAAIKEEVYTKQKAYEEQLTTLSKSDPSLKSYLDYTRGSHTLLRELCSGKPDQNKAEKAIASMEKAFDNIPWVPEKDRETGTNSYFYDALMDKDQASDVFAFARSPSSSSIGRIEKEDQLRNAVIAKKDELQKLRDLLREIVALQSGSQSGSATVIHEPEPEELPLAPGSSMIRAAAAERMSKHYLGANGAAAKAAATSSKDAETEPAGADPASWKDGRPEKVDFSRPSRQQAKENPPLTAESLAIASASESQPSVDPRDDLFNLFEEPKTPLTEEKRSRSRSRSSDSSASAQSSTGRSRSDSTDSDTSNTSFDSAVSEPDTITPKTKSEEQKRGRDRSRKS